VYSLRYGAEPFRLPGREKQLLLVGGRRLRGKEPLFAADQPVRSAGLAIAMVDRTNLPDAVEN